MGTKMSQRSSLPSQLQLSRSKQKLHIIGVFMAAPGSFMPPRERRLETEAVKMGNVGVTI